MSIDVSRAARWAWPLVVVAAATAVLTFWLMTGPLARGGGSANSAYADASWGDYYDNIPAMAAASDAVVIGRVVAGRTSVNDQGITHTDFELQVQRTLKGAPTANSSIVVYQTGGPAVNGYITEIEDDPLFKKGAIYLLFLTYYAPKQQYSVIGGPDGRFVVDGGKIEALSRAYPGRHIVDTGISGLTIDQVVKALSQPIPPSPTPPSLPTGSPLRHG